MRKTDYFLRNRVYFKIVIIIILLAGTCIADNNITGTWQGTGNSSNYPNGVTFTNWVIRSDGTTEGDWAIDIGGGVIVYSHASGTYTYIAGIYNATYTGMATESGYGTSTGYTLTQTNASITSCDNAAGNYNISFNPATGWPSSDSGGWNTNRITSPLQAIYLSPANGIANQSRYVGLAWSNGGGACTFDIYFGTNNPPTTIICTDTTVLTCDPGTLIYDTTYYWYVKSKNTNGTNSGPVWSFATNQPPSIESVSALPSYILDNQTSQLQVVASDSDGPSPLSYDWTVLSGQGALNDYTSPTPVYTPPDITSSQQTFTITVDVFDGEDVNSSSVDVTVIDIDSITCDFHQDWYIDFADFAILALYWGDAECTDPNWCEGTDVDHSGSTDILELTIFTECWLSEEIDPNLVAYWPMDDNAANTIVVDSSGQGYDGTAQRNTSALHTDSGNPPYLNGAFLFDGSSDHVAIPKESNLITGTNDFTVAGWFSLNNVSSIKNLICWKEPTSAVQFIITDGAGNTGIWADSKWLMSIAHSFTIGTWYHIAWTRNGNTWKVYINNAQIGSDVIDSCSLGTPIFDYHIGAEATAPSQFFSGKMDDVKIYDRALSGGEIADLYNE